MTRCLDVPTGRQCPDRPDRSVSCRPRADAPLVPADGHSAWATCPLTENGVIRIVRHPNYPNTPGSPAAVAAIMVQLRQLPGHVFWSDDISLVATERLDPARILTSAQVIDSYLLALAVSHGDRLATFDRRLSTKVLTGGKDALHIIAA